MSLNISSFNDICRLCLQNKENMKIITKEISIMLQYFTSFETKADDGLPENICIECSDQTFVSYNFKIQCETSYNKLHEIYNNKLSRHHQKYTDEFCDKSGDALEQSNDYDKEFIIKHIDQSSVNDQNNIAKDYNEVVNKEISSNLNNFDESDIHAEDQLSTDDDLNTVQDILTDSKLNIETTETNIKDTINRTRVKKVLSLGTDKCDISTFTCKICDKNFVCLYSLARHMELHDEHRKFRFQCPLCNKGFYERGSLKKHLSRHKGVVRYKCDLCSKGFYELSALSVHMKRHKVKPMICDICKKQFLVKLQYELHMKTHSTEKRYKCEKCGKGFDKAYYLKSHLISHIDERNYPCFLCDKEFKTEMSLKVHHRRCHTDSPKKTEVCNICGKSIIKYNMKYHLIRHSGAKEYKCSQCPRAFCQIYDLRAHYKLKHESNTKVKIHLCSVCGKKCDSAGNLSIHSRIHARVRPTYACELCEKKYKTKCGLKQHIRSGHMDERPHVCNICSKGFHTSRILQHHMRTHTGEKPFMCHLCQRAFSQKSSLRTHMKVHSIKIE